MVILGINRVFLEYFLCFFYFYWLALEGLIRLTAASWTICDWVWEGQGGILRILSNGEDQRIFLSLKFWILGFFWVGKLGKFFGVA